MKKKPGGGRYTPPGGGRPPDDGEGSSPPSEGTPEERGASFARGAVFPELFNVMGGGDSNVPLTLMVAVTQLVTDLLTAGDPTDFVES